MAKNQIKLIQRSLSKKFFLKSLWIKNKQFIIISFLIILLSGFLRFHDITKLQVFTADEEYQTTLAMTIVKNFHIIWIGVGASDTGFYLGPLWTYLTALLLHISIGDPEIFGYAAGLLGVITTGLIIIVGYKMFSFKIGILSGLLYATLPLIVYFDQKYWNVSLVPFLSLSMLFAIYLSNKFKIAWLFVALLLGLILNVHLSLIPLGLIALIVFIQQRDYLNSKILISAVLLFLVVTSPLILFDYFHDGSNIKTPIRMLSMISNSPYRIDPTSHSELLFKMMSRLWYLNPYSSNSDEVLIDCEDTPFFGNLNIIVPSSRTKGNAFITVACAVAIVWFLCRKKTWKNRQETLLASAILLLLLSYLFYPGAAHQYYLLGIFPLLIFLLCILVFSLKAPLKYIAFILVFAISITGIFTILNVNDNYGLSNKKTLIQKVMTNVKDETFELRDYGMCHQYEGWRYLFSVYGKVPTRSSTDNNLGWLYPSEISKDKVRYLVIMAEKKVPVNFNTKKATVFYQGGFSAYIFKNF